MGFLKRVQEQIDYQDKKIDVAKKGVDSNHEEILQLKEDYKILQEANKELLKEQEALKESIAKLNKEIEELFNLREKEEKDNSTIYDVVSKVLVARGDEE